MNIEFNEEGANLAEQFGLTIEGCERYRNKMNDELNALFKDEKSSFLQLAKLLHEYPDTLILFALCNSIAQEYKRSREDQEIRESLEKVMAIATAEQETKQ